MDAYATLVLMLDAHLSIPPNIVDHLSRQTGQKQQKLLPCFGTSLRLTSLIIHEIAASRDIAFLSCDRVRLVLTHGTLRLLHENAILPR